MIADTNDNNVFDVASNIFMTMGLSMVGMGPNVIPKNLDPFGMMQRWVDVWFNNIFEHREMRNEIINYFNVINHMGIQTLCMHMQKTPANYMCENFNDMVANFQNNYNDVFTMSGNSMPRINFSC